MFILPVNTVGNRLTLLALLRRTAQADILQRLSRLPHGDVLHASLHDRVGVADHVLEQIAKRILTALHADIERSLNASEALRQTRPNHRV